VGDSGPAGAPRQGRMPAYLDDLHARTRMTYCTIQVLNLASVGDVVLTERSTRCIVRTVRRSWSFV